MSKECIANLEVQESDSTDVTYQRLGRSNSVQKFLWDTRNRVLLALLVVCGVILLLCLYLVGATATLQRHGVIQNQLQKTNTAQDKGITKSSDVTEAAQTEEEDVYNVATARLGTSCTASSFYDEIRMCVNAMDDDIRSEWVARIERVGAWISFNFALRSEVTRVEIYPRCHKGDQCSVIQIGFSNGQYKNISRSCTGDPYDHICFLAPREVYPVNPPVMTSYVKLECMEECGVHNWGFRQVFIWANKP